MPLPLQELATIASLVGATIGAVLKGHEAYEKFKRSKNPPRRNRRTRQKPQSSAISADNSSWPDTSRVVTQKAPDLRRCPGDARQHPTMLTTPCYSLVQRPGDFGGDDQNDVDHKAKLGELGVPATLASEPSPTRHGDDL